MKETKPKRAYLLLWFSFFWVSITVLSPLEAGARGKNLQVLCTILPIYSLTLNVVGQVPGVNVELLLPAHQGCPHNYDLTPGDLIKLSRADLIIAHGLGMEEFLDQISRKVKTKAPIVLASEKIEPILKKTVYRPLGKEKTRKGSTHDHDDQLNEHAWVSPKAAAIMVRSIAEGLALRDPEQAATYRLNAQKVSKRLEDLFLEMKAVVSKAGNKKVIAVHDVLAYLARDVGLVIVGEIQSQSGKDPSPREMARLVKLIKDQRVGNLFSEPQFSDKVVRTLSRESGIPFFELDPAATGEPTAEAYERAMKKNLGIMKRALNP